MRKVYGFTIEVYENKKEGTVDKSFTAPIDKFIQERFGTKYGLKKCEKLMVEMVKTLHPNKYLVIEYFEKEI